MDVPKDVGIRLDPGLDGVEEVNTPSTVAARAPVAKANRGAVRDEDVCVIWDDLPLQGAGLTGKRAAAYVSSLLERGRRPHVVR